MATPEARSRAFDRYLRAATKVFDYHVAAHMKFTGYTVDVANGTVTVEYEIKSVPSIQNLYGAVHGGASITIMDIATTAAVFISDEKARGSVSVDMSMSYVRPATFETLRAKATVSKCGKTLAFTSFAMYDAKSGVLCCYGRHTKALLERARL